MLSNFLFVRSGFKTNCFVILLIGLPLFVVSQNKVTNNWVFGVHSGLDFNSGTVTPFYSSLYSYEGSSSISDTAGNLLFYTNGNYVWDKNGGIMPNGSGLKGHNNTGQLGAGGTSSTQGALIIKKPRTNSLYFVFTSSDIVDSYYYSEVDMSLNGGLGDVVNKNILLSLSGTEKLCAVNHSNDEFVWIMTHKANSNIFEAFLVDSNGVSMTPVVSQGDTLFQGNFGSVGQIKFSTDGKKLACANWSKSVSLYDFNSTTGVLSNPVRWGIPTTTSKAAYGLEFSPNDSLLYVCSAPGGNLYQFDISSHNADTILQTMYNYNLPYVFSSGGQLQLAVDGRIYCSNKYSLYLSVINAPNYRGALSNFCNQCINIAPGGGCYAGLPNFNQSLFKNVPSLRPPTVVNAVICAGQSVSVGNNLHTISGTYVDIIDSYGGYDSTVITHLIVLDSSSTRTQTITICEGDSLVVGTDTYSADGTYIYTFSGNGCDSTIITQLNVMPVSTYSQTLTLCQGESLTVGSHTYSTSGIYSDTLTSYIGCDSVVTTNLTIDPINLSTSYNNSMLTVGEANAVYQWFHCSFSGSSYTIISGQTAQSINIVSSGGYAVVVTKNNCSDTSGCHAIMTTNVSENNLINTFRVYYDPLTLQSNLLFAEKQESVVLRIINVFGEEIKVIHFSGNEMTIDKESIPSGVYFVQLFMDSYNAGNLKIIIP